MILIFAPVFHYNSYTILCDLTTTMNDRYLESWGISRKEAHPFLYSPNDD